MYFPSFYVLKGWMEGRAVVDSLTNAFYDMPENVKALWALWVPAQLINFSVVPLHLRIPFGRSLHLQIHAKAPGSAALRSGPQTKQLTEGHYSLPNFPLSLCEPLPLLQLR